MELSISELAQIVLWWSLTVALGLVAFPLVSRVCRALPDRGYSAAKAAGIALATYFIWLFPSLRLLPFGLGDVAVSLGIVVLLAAILVRRAKVLFPPQAGTPVPPAGFRIFCLSEVIFAAAFGFFAWMLWLRPDIFAAQLEDFANFGFLQSIHRATYFPPEDPWFAGRSLPYYYGGHLIVAWMGRLTRIPPEISFNLASAMFYGLAITLSFGLGYNLTRKIRYGFLTAVVVGFMGYVTGFFQFLLWVVQLDLFGPLPEEAVGFTQWLFSFPWWWTIRIIPNTVTFYPYYIMSNADVHPMATSIPFQLLVLQLALARAGDRSSQSKAVLFVHYLFIGLLVGFLIIINSWAYPVFLLFVFLVFLIFRSGIRRFALIAVPSLVFYLPFLVSRTVQGFRGIGLVLERTPLYGYAAIAGVFWVILFFLLFTFRQARRKRVLLAMGAALVGAAAAWSWDLQILVVLLPALAATVPLLLEGGLEDRERFVLLLVTMGILVAVGADLFYVRDGYAAPFERYNTIMKLYLMQWVFLGLAAAVGLFLIGRHARRKAGLILRTIATLCLLASLVHPVASTVSWTSGKPKNLGPGRGTLDGLAYLEQVNEGDHAAIRWLNRNVAGSEVVLETPSETEIGVYHARVASLTGLPALLGWGPWEVQWGRSWEEVKERARDIATIYNSENLPLELIRKYRIKYIYIGEEERENYDDSGLEKFQSRSEYFEKVYDEKGVQIFRVVSMP